VGKPLVSIELEALQLQVRKKFHARRARLCTSVETSTCHSHVSNAYCKANNAPRTLPFRSSAAAGSESGHFLIVPKKISSTVASKSQTKLSIQQLAQ